MYREHTEVDWSSSNNSNAFSYNCKFKKACSHHQPKRRKQIRFSMTCCPIKTFIMLSNLIVNQTNKDANRKCSVKRDTSPTFPCKSSRIRFILLAFSINNAFRFSFKEFSSIGLRYLARGLSTVSGSSIPAKHMI